MKHLLMPLVILCLIYSPHTTYAYTPKKLGYNFTGWELEGGGSFDDSTKTYTYGDNNGVLHAKFDPIIRTITIDGNGKTFVDGYINAYYNNSTNYKSLQPGDVVYVQS